MVINPLINRGKKVFYLNLAYSVERAGLGVRAATSAINSKGICLVLRAAAVMEVCFRMGAVSVLSKYCKYFSYHTITILSSAKIYA